MDTQAASARMLQLIGFFVILIIALIAFIHYLTSRDTVPGGGPASPEYLKFLRKKKSAPSAIRDIPLPPEGKRDEEVEALIMSGKITRARELLETRMEEARVAPIGREARIRNVAYYMGLIDKL